MQTAAAKHDGTGTHAALVRSNDSSGWQRSRRTPFAGNGNFPYGQQLGPRTGCNGHPDSQRTETPNPLRPNQTVLGKRIFPSRLCDTEVKVGGIAAGLLYVQAGQINLKAPQQIPVQGTTTVQVTYNGRLGPAVTQTLGPGATEPAERLAEEIWTNLHEVRWERPYEGTEHAGAGCKAVLPHPDLRGGLYAISFIALPRPAA